jgi:hypothetical protein
MQRRDNAGIITVLKGMITLTDKYLLHLENESLKKLTELGFKATLGPSMSPPNLKAFLVEDKAGIDLHELSFQQLSNDFPNEIIFNKLSVVNNLCQFILHNQNAIKINPMRTTDLVAFKDNLEEMQAELSNSKIRKSISVTRDGYYDDVDTDGGKYLNSLDNYIAAARYDLAENQAQLLEVFKENIVFSCNNFKAYLGTKPTEERIENKKNVLDDIIKNITVAVDKELDIDSVYKIAKQKFDENSAKLNSHGGFFAMFKPRTESGNCVNFLYNQTVHLLDRAKELKIEIKPWAPKMKV